MKRVGERLQRQGSLEKPRWRRMAAVLQRRGEAGREQRGKEDVKEKKQR